MVRARLGESGSLDGIARKQARFGQRRIDARDLCSEARDGCFRLRDASAQRRELDAFFRRGAADIGAASGAGFRPWPPAGRRQAGRRPC
jgi:hypothetical protein